MQVTETKSEGLSREYKVALPAKDIEDKISTRLKEIAQTLQLPGFRPGKVPVALLRKRYGPSIMGEILEKAVGDSSQQALSEQGVRPAMQPEIEITSFEDGKDLEYTISVETLPDIGTVEFSGITLERYVPATDEKAVEEALGRIADANKSSQPIEGNRESKNGDVVVIDFTGRVDGEEFPGGKADGYELELGSGSFIPGFEEQLVGAKAGDGVDVKVTFPEAYGAADLAGKDAVFEVAVREIRETQAADIDDELAKKLGLESLDKLKESIVEEQGREFKELARMRMKRALLDQLSDAHDFEIPEKLANQEFDNIWNQYEEQKKAAAEGEGDAETGEDDDKPEEEQKAEFRDIAVRRVRLGLLLAEIGRQNNLQVAQEDINRALMEEARRHPGQEHQVLEFYKENPQAMESLTAPVYEDKVVDFVIEMAQVTEKQATSEELMKALEDDAEEAKSEDKKKKKSKAKPKAKAKADTGDEDKPKKKPAKKKAAAKKSE